MRVGFEMDIESFSGAATVAAACTIIFVLVTKSWRLITRHVQTGPAFGGNFARESAQRFRDELERLSQSLSSSLAACLVFALLFVSAYALEADRLYTLYPDWQLGILVAVLALGALLVVARLALTVVNREQVKLLRDANIAIGQQLQKSASSFGRVFHDVETTAGIIDHVIVGRSGAYAIHVFARRPVRDGRVRLDNNELQFEPSGRSLSIIPAGKCIAALEREFRRLLDHRVRVRSVIAVPGWDVREQAIGDHLLVNEHSLAMLQGWKDQSDALLNEDVRALHTMLASLTTA